MTISFKVHNIKKESKNTWEMDNLKWATKTTPVKDIFLSKYATDHIDKDTSRRDIVIDPKKTVESFTIESTSTTLPELLHFGNNPLVDAVKLAWSYHLPLTLTPDHFWITIAQGFSQHVRLNAESLREKFVSHEGQKHIEVFDAEVPELYGSQGAINWHNVVGVFSSKLRSEIGPKRHAMIVSEFSTTGVVEQTVSEIVLMDALKSYFTYGFTTMCGFPLINLMGTVEDYKKVRAKTQALSEFGLEKWVSQLLPVLDNIIQTVELSANSKYADLTQKEHSKLQEFWASMFDHHGGSGMDDASGWIVNFFPYTKRDKASKFTRMDMGDFPSGISYVPFRWNNNGILYDMAFCGGFLGGELTPGVNEVSPKLGWYVLNKGLSK